MTPQKKNKARKIRIPMWHEFWVKIMSKRGTMSNKLNRKTSQAGLTCWQKPNWVILSKMHNKNLFREKMKCIEKANDEEIYKSCVDN